MKKIIDVHPGSNLLGHDQKPDLGLNILPDPGETSSQLSLNILTLKMFVQVHFWNEKVKSKLQSKFPDTRNPETSENWMI